MDVRFLHVLQGADASIAMTPARYLQSTAGTAFDGAVFASTAVYFPRSAGIPFVGTSLPTPSGIHSIYVTGLTPGTPYAVSVGSGTVTVTTGTGSVADSAGVLNVTF
jgi:hypothetical protein